MHVYASADIASSFDGGGASLTAWLRIHPHWRLALPSLRHDCGVRTLSVDLY